MIEKIKSVLSADLPGTQRGDAETRNQVYNYHTLGFFKSARGVATWLILFYLLIHLVNTLQGKEEWIDLSIYLIVYLPLAYIIYKGKSWGVIITILTWTADRLYAFTQSGDWTNIILWFILLASLVQAAKVEYGRKRASQGKSIVVDKPTPFRLLKVAGVTSLVFLVIIVIFVVYVVMFSPES